MAELDPAVVTAEVSAESDSDLALAERPTQRARRDVSLMDKLLIEGNGPLSGEIRVSGAKNAALPIMCAALLTPEALALNNVPNLQDVRTMLKLLRQMGVEGALDGHNLTLDAANIHSPEAPYDLVKTMRASILVLGPLLARFGHARVSLPGGCGIGARPVDQHIKGLQQMGA